MFTICSICFTICFRHFRHFMFGTLRNTITVFNIHTEIKLILRDSDFDFLEAWTRIHLLHRSVFWGQKSPWRRKGAEEGGREGFLIVGALGPQKKLSPLLAAQIGGAASSATTLRKSNIPSKHEVEVFLVPRFLGGRRARLPCFCQCPGHCDHLLQSNLQHCRRSRLDGDHHVQLVRPARP
jgi:hypothetical protein